MRRLMRFCGSLSVLLALVWCAIWFVGRGEIDARLDDELGRLAARNGLEIRVGERSIAGFPFAYAAEFRDVTLSDAGSGARTALPALRSSVSVAAPGQVVTELPPRFTLALPLDPAMRARHPGLPAELEIALEGDGLSVVTDALGDGGLRLSISAERLRLRPVGQAGGLSFSADIEGLSGEIAFGAPPDPEGMRGRASLAMRFADITFDIADGSGGRIAVAAALEGAQLGGQTSAGDGAALERLVRGLPGIEGRVTLAAARVEGEVTAAGAGASDGSVGLGAERLNARLEIADGGAEAGANAAATRLALAPAAAGNPVAGELTTGRLGIEAAVPLAPGPLSRRIALAAEAEGVAPSPALWAQIDPEGRLPREAGALALALEGSGRITRPHGQRAPGAPPPLELDRLTLSRLDLEGLGASATGKAALTFTKPAQHPRGTADFRLSGALALIRRLHAAGLIDEPTVQKLAMLAALYTRAGKGPDELVVDLAFRQDGLEVNGEPVH